MIRPEAAAPEATDTGADRRGSAIGNPDAVAVIIGNRTYPEGIPEVRFAVNDASAMRRFVTRGLGVRSGNVIELVDAGQAAMISVFGNRADHRGRLWQYVRDGRSDVFVYYSGHGVPGLRDRRGYLLPVDADPSTPELNGYPLDLLLANLEKLRARSVTVVVDACFSGNSAGGWLIRSASPVYVQTEPLARLDGVVLITASEADQVASWDAEAGLGLFTRHFLDAVWGAADRRPHGDGDRAVTLGEIDAYLAEEMSYAARRQFGRVQTASVAGPLERVIVPELPPRPPALAVPEPGPGTGGPTEPAAASSLAIPGTREEARAYVLAHRQEILATVQRYYKESGRIWDTERIGISLQEPRELVALKSVRVTGLVENGFDIRARYDFLTDTLKRSAEGRFRLVFGEGGLEVAKMWR